MIEEYGTLSEEELLEEIIQDLDENTELDSSELEFKFEGGKLHIYGTLNNEEELENLIGVLENHIDPEDYHFEVDLIEGEHRTLDSSTYGADKVETSEKFLEETLDDIDDDEIDFVDEEGFDEDDKW